jgi:hypothetical protein
MKGLKHGHFIINCFQTIVAPEKIEKKPLLQKV